MQVGVQSRRTRANVQQRTRHVDEEVSVLNVSVAVRSELETEKLVFLRYLPGVNGLGKIRETWIDPAVFLVEPSSRDRFQLPVQ